MTAVGRGSVLGYLRKLMSNSRMPPHSTEAGIFPAALQALGV
jgi:hypothetical protein